MWKIFIRSGGGTKQSCPFVRSWTCSSNDSEKQLSPISSVDSEKENTLSTDLSLSECRTLDKKFGPEIFLPRTFSKKQTNCGSSESAGSSSHQNSNRNSKKNDDGTTEQFKHDLIGAITWSGAIICGWYASQIYCFRRKRFGWNLECNSDKYLKYLQIPKRAIHSNVTSHYVSTSPPAPDQPHQQLFYPTIVDTVRNNPTSFFKSHENIEKDEDIIKVKVRNVNNPERSESISSNSSNSSKQSVSEAVNDLVNFIGECEFKMASRHIDLHNYRDAVIHLKLALSHNHPGGCYNLGVCYEQGLGVRKNSRLAMQCYQKAAGLGHPQAMFNLGVFYAQGLGGLGKDRNAAKKCMITAAKLGQDQAKDFLLSIADTDEEIANFLKYDNERSSLNFAEDIMLSKFN